MWPKLALLQRILLVRLAGKVWYNASMTPKDPTDITKALAARHGGPIEMQIEGKDVVFMTMDVYREMMGVGSDEELQESLAAIDRGLEAAKEGRTRPFREALDDLGRKYEAT